VLNYGYVYVANVAMGADPMQTMKAFIEAETYDGPSIIIAYSHCIAHGYNLVNGHEEQKKAVAAGHWPLYRYNPDLCAQGKNPLQLDSKAPSIKLEDYIYNENRYRVLQKTDPERAKVLLEKAQKIVRDHYDLYEYLSKREFCKKEEPQKQEAEKK
ncbi:MAG: pyruvate:ferredoxin (flavodoxin) oxidoreductase, partial [Candidatus Omnitrophota bacterium]